MVNSVNSQIYQYQMSSYHSQDDKVLRKLNQQKASGTIPIVQAYIYVSNKDLYSYKQDKFYDFDNIDKAFESMIQYVSIGCKVCLYNQYGAKITFNPDFSITGDPALHDRFVAYCYSR